MTKQSHHEKNFKQDTIYFLKKYANYISLGIMDSFGKVPLEKNGTYC